MQHICAVARAFFGSSRLLPVLLAPVLIAAGCIERPTTLDPPPDRPHAGTVLTAAASDPADREFLQRLAKSWSTHSGAEIRVLDTPWVGNADIGLVAPAEISRWAEAGQLSTAPANFTPTDPYRWDDVLAIYARTLMVWRNRAYALPILGEGMVLVYRADVFDGIEGRPGNPPTTWDDLVGMGGRYFKEPYLPPVPRSSERLLAEYFAAAACYDRPAIGRFAPGVLPDEEFFAFQFDVPKLPQPDQQNVEQDVATAEPRLERPPFRHVANLFRQMGAYRVQGPDAAAAFRSGHAKVGILSLAELGRVGPDMAEKLGVAPLPGSRFTFDANGEKRPTDQDTVNRVPYLGWGGRAGVVSAKCANTAAAWDFILDGGLPDRAALDLIATPGIGAGPYRMSQLDVRARSRWFAYGLSAIETERLTSALRDNLGLGVQNPRLRLRTPNQHELAAALDEDLRAMLKDQTPVEQAMAKANNRWKQIILKQPAAQWNAELRVSLGLEATR
jgi:ABC-type glycerol-3-phosphate transport system substrate-binding protein